MDNNKAYCITKKGGRTENQDYLAQKDSKFGKLLILCDGAGGHEGGSIAAKAAADYVYNNIDRQDDNLKIESILSKLMEEANNLLVELAVANSISSGIKSTIVIALINDSDLHVMHAGDSRLYQIRNNKVVFRTKDHSLLERYRHEGQIITEEEELNHKEGNVIINCLGTRNGFFYDYKMLPIKKTDIVLLTSDGIHGVLLTEQILNVFKRNSKNIEALANELSNISDAEGASKKNNYDNLSLICYQSDQAEFDILKYLKWALVISSFALLCLFIYQKVSNPDPTPIPDSPANTVIPPKELEKENKNLKAELVQKIDSLLEIHTEDENLKKEKTRLNGNIYGPSYSKENLENLKNYLDQKYN